MSVGHLNFFFGEVSVHILCPFFIWNICFLFVEVCELFIYFRCQHFIRSVIYEYILLYCRVPFCSIDGVLCCTKAFQLDVVPCVHFCFCFPCSRRCIQEKIAHVYIQEIFAYVFFNSFVVSCLIFRSLIHLCLLWY